MTTPQNAPTCEVCRREILHGKQCTNGRCYSCHGKYCAHGGREPGHERGWPCADCDKNAATSKQRSLCLACAVKRGREGFGG